MRKKISAAYIAAFMILFIAAPIIYNIVGPYFDQTNYEQRNAAEKPVLSVGSIRDYPRTYEEYFNDHLPYRTQMIEINSLVDFWVFQQSPVRKVIVGKDGWLFYNPEGTDGDPIADYNGMNLYSEDQLDFVAEHLVQIRDELKQQGKRFIVLIPPNKECVYGTSFLPDGYVSDNTITRADQVVQWLRNRTDLEIIYPKTEILSAINQYPQYDLYYKTDTHWNAIGAYIGACQLLKQLDIELPGLDQLECEAMGYSGDLASMMGLSKYLQYDKQYCLAGYTAENTIKGEQLEEGNSNQTLYTNSCAIDQSVFVVRDSFSEAIMPILASQFQSCFFVHRASYTPDLLKQYPSDVVVLEVVERYLDYLSGFTID